MIVPGEAFRRLLVACLMGAGLGILYGFLRPPRRRHPHLSDLLFSGCAFWVWLYLSFAVCRGDVRIGYTAGLFIGCIGWELTFGKLLRPLFSCFWQVLAKIWAFSLRPGKIFLKK